LSLAATFSSEKNIDFYPPIPVGRVNLML